MHDFGDYKKLPVGCVIGFAYITGCVSFEQMADNKWATKVSDKNSFCWIISQVVNLAQSQQIPACGKLGLFSLSSGEEAKLLETADGAVVLQPLKKALKLRKTMHKNKCTAN
jgi:hypothetical protein